MDIIGSIKELLNLDDPPAIPLDQRRTNAKAAIEAWLPTQTATQYRLEPNAFADRLRFLVDSPHALRQGAYGWCLPAAFLHSALRRFPDEVAKFGLSLYSTGAGKLGNIDVTLTDAFRDFDYPETIRSDQDLPQRNRDLYLASHADWILLGAIQDDTTIYPMTGSPHDPVSFSSGTLVDLFEDCGFYTDVTTLSMSTKRNRQDLLTELAKCQTHDVLLVGSMSRFGAPGTVEHAVRLIAPPEIAANGNNGTAAENETMTFKFWSWGFQPSSVAGLPFDAAQNAFTFQVTRRLFEFFEIIVAEPEPI
jgi:hypothetical protein